ncbi:hypothetical protein Cgig2_004520 [Carnegiea gigantea]|uniref:DUF4283 domain-containing protein n=1 Tax=Carnegiea gigantea TaxID=171969 RepID=A0A9Q1K7P1_9CARY|nr:hypothetical protein Cgig2_004520 [Carnegiea gigantea]
MPPYPHPIHMSELLACCVMGKIWGDPVPLPAIIHNTKKDWSFVKGHVDYIDASNDWIMLQFTNAVDRLLVYDQRPWHVNGLNLLILKWTSFFDPYTTPITSIDQWVRVPGLPGEFWELDSLTDLKKPMGPVVKVDQNTLLRLKVSSKKRIRSLIGPRHKKTCNLKTQDTALVPSASSPLLVPTQSPIEKVKGIPGPTGPNEIILANPNAIEPQDDCSTPSDNLLAMVEDGDGGIEDDANIDMFLNLENIEDVEMSTDSTKRKRIEEGEELTPTRRSYTHT